MEADQVQAGTDMEFWRLPDVERASGLKKSNIYARIKDGTFPASRPYRHNPRSRFWLSTEVRAWQVAEAGLLQAMDDLVG